MEKLAHKKLIIGIIAVFFIIGIFVYILKELGANQILGLEDFTIILNGDKRLPDNIKPFPIDSQDVSPLGESDLPPQMTQEYMDKQMRARAVRLLGPSIVEVSGEGALEIPFKLGEETELLSASGYAFNEWASPSKFIFTDYGNGPCDFFCEGEKFLYDINTKTKTLFDEDSKRIVSPNGRLAIAYEEGSAKEPTESLGVLYMKDMQSGEIRDLGKSVRGTGYDGSYTGTCLWAFAWSPDSKNIAMLDWCDYDAEFNGPAVEVLSADAKDISERRFLGYTRYREIERPKGERLIFWSPDSTKFYAKDSYVVFDAVSGKELFRPEKDFAPFVSWSPDSKKIIAIAHNSGFAVVDAADGNAEGYLFTEMPMLFEAREVVWMPDGKHILVADSGYGRKSYIFYFDTEARKFGRIKETEADEFYRNILVSPDAKNLVYIYDDKIMLRPINWKQ